MIRIMVTRYKSVTKYQISRGHPVDLYVPSWFPAALKLACAVNGCPECQESLERPRHFPLAIDPEGGM